MSTFVMQLSDKPRRDILIALSELFEEDRLEEYAGQNALVDCALYMYTEDDPELREKLNTVLDTKQLRDEIKHVRASAALRKKRKDVIACRGLTTKR